MSDIIDMPANVPAAPRPGMPFTSPTVAQVCTALATAQGKFRTPKRTKTATVTPRDGGRGYTFSYAPLEEIIDAVKDALAENGLARFQLLIRSNAGDYVRTIIWHASGEFLSGDYPVMYQKEGAQAYAGGVTYAKRNGLSMVLGLAPEDDDDGNAADGNTATVAATRKPKPPADNVMVPPHDPVTGEVPAKQVDEAYAELERHIARLTAAAQGRGGLPADLKLREEWDKTPKRFHQQLKQIKDELKQIAAQTDAAIENFR